MTFLNFDIKIILNLNPKFFIKVIINFFKKFQSFFKNNILIFSTINEK